MWWKSWNNMDLLTVQHRIRFSWRSKFRWWMGFVWQVLCSLTRDMCPRLWCNWGRIIFCMQKLSVSIWLSTKIFYAQLVIKVICAPVDDPGFLYEVHTLIFFFSSLRCILLVCYEYGGCCKKNCQICMEKKIFQYRWSAFWFSPPGSHRYERSLVGFSIKVQHILILLGLFSVDMVRRIEHFIILDQFDVCICSID